MMLINLNKKGYNAFAISIPSPSDLLAIFELAAPAFLMMMSNVCYILPDLRLLLLTIDYFCAFESFLYPR